MKKILFILIAALAFVSCSKDDDKKGSDTFTSAQDFSQYIDMSYTDMTKALGTPAAVNGDKVKYYVYLNPAKNVSRISVGVNPDNNKVFSVVEMLSDDAFEATQIRSYFASKLTYYYINDDGDYVYGNTAVDDDATLAVFTRDNASIIYSNPQNEADEEMGTIPGTPVEVANILLTNSISKLKAAYPNTLFDCGDNSYYITYYDDDYLSKIALITNGARVTSLVIEYSSDLTDADILKYYESQGYVYSKTGTDDGEGHPTYLIVNKTNYISITYCNLMGMIIN